MQNTAKVKKLAIDKTALLTKVRIDDKEPNVSVKKI